MNNSFSITNLKDVLRFPFATSRNKSNFFVGALLMLGGMFVPILPVLAVYGYLAQIARGAINGEEPTMPEWNNFGKLLKDGIRGVGIVFIYTLPGLMVMSAGYLAYFVGIFSASQMQTAYSRSAVGDTMMGFFASIGIFLISLAAGMALMILGAFPLPAALANFVAKDRIGAGFELGVITRLIRKDLLGYAVGWVALMGLYTVANLVFSLLYVTVIFCFVGFLVIMPMAFYVLAVGAVLFGRHYRENQPA